MRPAEAGGPNSTAGGILQTNIHPSGPSTKILIDAMCRWVQLREVYIYNRLADNLAKIIYIKLQPKLELAVALTNFFSDGIS